MEKDLSGNEGEPWRVLEFYSGIGGMVPYPNLSCTHVGLSDTPLIAVYVHISC